MQKLPWLVAMLLVLSLIAVIWGHSGGALRDNWSKTVTIRTREGTTTSCKMMVYVNSPIVISGQTVRVYLRIKNTGKHPLELTSTYVTNRSYVNGDLHGEEIGDWQSSDFLLRLLPGEVRSVPFEQDLRPYSSIYNAHVTSIGRYGFQFCGYGLETNTVTVYVLPSRSFWLVLAALAALVAWSAWRRAKPRRPQ